MSGTKEKTILQIIKDLDSDGHYQCPLYHKRLFEEYVKDDLIASCPGCAFGIRHKALIDNNLSWNEKAAYQRLWLKHCINTETDFIFQIFKEYDPKINREGDVHEIIKKGLAEEALPLARLIGAKSGVSNYKNVLISWFLKRYNWRRAFLLHLRKDESCWTFFVTITITLLPLLMLFILTMGSINLKPSLVHHPLLMTEYQISGGLHVKVTPELKDILSSAVSGLPCFVEVFGIIFLVFTLLLSSSRKYRDFIFPRFFGASFIGLLPLVTQDITWTFPLRMNWGQIYLLSGVSLLIAFIYLTIECGKTTEFRGWKVIERTLPITFYGLLISLSLSLICCDILAIHCLDYDKILYGTSYKGFLGLLYPKIVVLFAFFSFLIGIFVQIFWEEKTVTEPL